MGIWIASVYILATDSLKQGHFQRQCIYNDQFSGDVENENQSESWIGICQVKYVPAIITRGVSLEVNVQAC